MVCSRGESLTHRINQMKLLNTIAAAVVIGTPLITADSARASNGWIDAGTSIKGDTIYVRPLSRNGNLVTYERHLDGYKSKMVANCPAWQYRRATGSQWSDVMPNLIGASAHRTVCSANIPTFMPKHTYSNTVQISCNEKVDAVFYRRYPELRGTKLTSMNGSLSREWISIQDSIC